MWYEEVADGTLHTTMKPSFYRGISSTEMQSVVHTCT